MVATTDAKARSGWHVVAGLFVVLTVSSGFGFYNMSVYMNVLAGERGFSVSALSGAVSTFFVVGGVAGIWVARLLERHDVRWIMIGGAALAGAALAATGWSESVPATYLLFLVFGIGNTGVSIVVSTTLVTRWFPGPNRSIALSVASTGLSMGGILITPLSAWAFERWHVATVLPTFGALFFLLILPIALLVIRDGRGIGHRGGTASLDSGWSYPQAVRTRFFRLLTVGYIFCMTAQVGGISHLYNHAEGLAGYVVAATSVQALTLMSIVCRVLGGVLLTRIPTRWFLLGNLLGQALGLAVLAAADTRLELLGGAALFGATVGNLLMLQPLWLAEVFGASAYPRLFSVSNAWSVLGVSVGPLLLGMMYDLFDYPVAYATAMAASVIAAALIFAAGVPAAASMVDAAECGAAVEES
jgi:predicted MFS family arabinose efflux permease